MADDVKENELTILEHLDELRTRIIICLIGIAVCTVAGWYLGTYALDFLISYVKEVQYLSPADPIKMRIKVAIILGFMIASPLIIAEVWLFVAPGLYKHERRFAIPATIASFLLFFLGGAFGFAIIPFTLDFLETFSTEAMNAQYALPNFISFASTFIFAFAIVFQIPIALVMLAKIGIVNYQMLASNRKYAFIFGLVIGAILTPADPASMFFLAAPLYVLFEISLIFIRFMKPVEREEEPEEEPEP